MLPQIAPSAVENVCNNLLKQGKELTVDNARSVLATLDAEFGYTVGMGEDEIDTFLDEFDAGVESFKTRKDELGKGGAS